MQISSKYGEICDIKKLKTIPWPKNIFSNLFSRNLKKNASYITKIAKICDIKKLKTIPRPIKNFQ